MVFINCDLAIDIQHFTSVKYVIVLMNVTITSIA